MMRNLVSEEQRHMDNQGLSVLFIISFLFNNLRSSHLSVFQIRW